MRVGVTGGNGRLGRKVIEVALADGHTVVNIDRVAQPEGEIQPGVDFVAADVADYEGLLTALTGCEALIHLAAIPSPGRHPDHVVHHNNVMGSYNALRVAAELGIWRVCQASSINAIGGAYSRWPRYDYFPLDEQHPTYSEDPYSLSKWICEQQGEALVRRYEQMQVASLRFHGVAVRETAVSWQTTHHDTIAKHLWGYTSPMATARACLLGITAVFPGHQVFYIVAPETMMDTPSLALRNQFYPDVPVRGGLDGRQGFFNCQKAEQMLGWRHI